MPRKNTKPEVKEKETTIENTNEKVENKPSSSGRFQKGRAKTGGRKSGVKNKYSNVRDRLKDIIMPYLETNPDNMVAGVPTLMTDIQKIDDPKDRADVISKFMPFVVPKYSSTTVSADSNRPVDEEQELLDLDAQYTKKELTLTLKQVTIVDNDNKAAPPAAPITDFDPDEEDDFDLEDLK